MFITPLDKKELDYIKVPQAHANSLNGQGVNLLEIEHDTIHCQKVKNIYEFVSNGGKAFNQGLSYSYINGKLTSNIEEIEQAIIDHDIKILGRSQRMEMPEELANEFYRLRDQYNLIFITAAGNDHFNGLAENEYTHDLSISVGELRFDGNTLVRTLDSAVGEELDISTISLSDNGTSFASPVLCGQVSWICNQLPNITHNQVFEYLKNHSKYLGEKRFYGYGVPIFTEVEIMNKPERIILHHSATDGGTFESIEKYHIEHNGWNDIGYHYLIEQDGSLHKGRGETTTGAHTIGQNEKSLGICLVGNFDKYEPSDMQMKTLNTLLLDINQRLGITEIKGHNHYSSKTCPGIYFRWKDVINLEEEKNEHWAEKHFQSLNAKGILVSEKRFDDKITRGEVLALLDRLTDK